MSANEWSADRLVIELPELREVQLLGRGGFASVYQARHPRLGLVAVKMLTGGVGWELDEESRLEFWTQVRTETEAIGSLSGAPNIVTLHTSGLSTSGWPYLVMELCPGGSVSDLLRRRRTEGLGPADAVTISEVGRAVGSALTTAHGHHVLHLDVKPANVLVSRFGVYKLTDFGIARHLLEGRDRGGEVYLTPHYAAPELWGSSPLPVPATDVYALGVTLYQLATLRRPYEGSTPTELAVRVRTEPPPPMGRADLPPPLVELIMGCMATDPADRPSALDVVGRLVDIVARDDDTRTMWVGSPEQLASAGSGIGATSAEPQVDRSADEDLTRVRSDAERPGALRQRPGEVATPTPPSTGGPADRDPGMSRSSGRRRVGAAIAAIALLCAVLVGLVAWRSTASPELLDDATVLDGVADQVVAPPGTELRSRTDSLGGQPSTVSMGAVRDGRAELSWTVETPLDEVRYATIVATFSVDPRTGLTEPEPQRKVMLGVDGGAASTSEPIARWGAEQRSVEVPVPPDVVSCFRPVAITVDRVVPSGRQVCAPTEAPAAPRDVAVAVAADGTSATVSWSAPGDARRLRVLRVAEVDGREQVLGVTDVAPGSGGVTTAWQPGSCVVVRAENAANATPDELEGQGVPDARGRSEPFCP